MIDNEYEEEFTGKGLDKLKWKLESLKWVRGRRTEVVSKNQGLLDLIEKNKDMLS